MSMAAGKSEAAYRAEMAKCVLVCANCHGEIETGMRASPAAGARFGGVVPAPEEEPAAPVPRPRLTPTDQLELSPSEPEPDSG